MARLRRGFEVLHDEAEERSREHTAQHAHSAEARRKAANPHRAAPGRASDGDHAALAEFAENQNLR